jgi:hypothetical protein
MAREEWWVTPDVAAGQDRYDLQTEIGGAGLSAVCEIVSGLFDLTPNPECVAAPNLGDLLCGVTPANELEGDVEGLTSISPTHQAPGLIVEIRADSNVIDPDTVNKIIYMIYEIINIG